MAETFAATPAIRSTTVWTVVGANAFLQLMDWISTFLALSAGAVEANPLVRALLEAGGWGAFAALKVGLAVLFISLARPTADLMGGYRRFVVASMGGLAVVMTLVVVNNLTIALA